MSLNAIKIENLKPRKADYRVADGGGLYVLVRPNGSKLWRYDYRLGVARRTLSIGEYSPQGDGKSNFTLKQARDEHEDARAAVKAGQHPISPAQRTAAIAKAEAEAQERAEQEAGDRSFGALADQWLAARKVGHSEKTYARDLRSAAYLKNGYRGGQGLRRSAGRSSADSAPVEPCGEVQQADPHPRGIGRPQDHGRRQT